MDFFFAKASLKGDDLQKTELTIRSLIRNNDTGKINDILGNLTSSFPGLKLAMTAMKDVGSNYVSMCIYTMFSAFLLFLTLCSFC